MTLSKLPKTPNSGRKESKSARLPANPSPQKKPETAGPSVSAAGMETPPTPRSRACGRRGRDSAAVVDVDVVVGRRQGQGRINQDFI